MFISDFKFCAHLRSKSDFGFESEKMKLKIENMKMEKEKISGMNFSHLFAYFLKLFIYILKHK